LPPDRTTTAAALDAADIAFTALRTMLAAAVELTCEVRAMARNRPAAVLAVAAAARNVERRNDELGEVFADSDSGVVVPDAGGRAAIG
jgi:hypothetical protein